MVKKTACLWILLLVCNTGFGQKNVQQLFNEFTKMKGVEQVNIGAVTMTFASLFAETMGVKSVEVVSLNSCSDEMKAHFRQAVGSCKDEAFDTVINTSENGNRVKVLLRIENNVARELVVLSSGNDLAMIRIKGKIKQSDMERAIAEHRK